MNVDVSKIREFFRNYWLIILMLIVSTIPIILNHFYGLSWDFAAYVLNGKYFFSRGEYFEILRPPLPSILISAFSFAGWRAGEFLYIIFVSTLFAYSSVRLAKALKFNIVLFYALSLNFFLLYIGLVNGSELLSLCFLELSLALILENKYASGISLGLSALSRYTSLVFFPFILLHLNPKKIFQSILLFAATLIPWFLYNFFFFGNYFTSLADQFANNILYREYLMEPMKLMHFVEVQNILIPFFLVGIVVGIIYVIKQFSMHFKTKDRFAAKNFLNLAASLKIEIIMFSLLIHAVFVYRNIPMKDSRYLFNLILPTIYFAYIGVKYLLDEIKSANKKKTLATIKKLNTKKSADLANPNKNPLVIFAIIFFAVNILIAGYSIIRYEQENVYTKPNTFNRAVFALGELNLSNCNVESNSWIYLNYLGRTASPAPRPELINVSLMSGNTIIIFFAESGPDNMENNKLKINPFVLYQNKDYLILNAGKCKPISNSTSSYLDQLDNAFFAMNNYHINKNPCFVMFHNFSFAEKTCNFVNLNGFRLDEYRVVE
jgi:hypothetical protein